MKMQEWLCVLIIAVGAVSAVRQVNLIKHEHNTKRSLTSILADQNNVRQSNIRQSNMQSADCLARHIISQGKTIALELSIIGVNTINRIYKAE